MEEFVMQHVVGDAEPEHAHAALVHATAIIHDDAPMGERR
jgi:hypothetical protein